MAFSVRDVLPEDEERTSKLDQLFRYLIDYGERWRSNASGAIEDYSRAPGKFQGVSVGPMASGALTAYNIVAEPALSDLQERLAKSLYENSLAMHKTFSGFNLGGQQQTLMSPPTMEDARQQASILMMAGVRGGRPPGGGIWPKGKKSRELANIARREEKAKNLVVPLAEADAPPEIKSTDPQELTPYTQYREAINNMLEASREKKLEYGNLAPNVMNPEADTTRPTKDWRGNWATETVPGVELSEHQKTLLEDQNKRTTENFNFWDKRVDKLEELAGQLENAESGYRSGDRKWFDRYGRPVFPFEDYTSPQDLFEKQFAGFVEDLDIQADKFFDRATPQEERARAEREQLAEESIKGKKHKFKTERPIQPTGGVQISDDEYALGVRQIHFNEDGSLTDEGVKLLREHDIQVKTLAERNRKQASPDEAALGRFAEIKRREEETILHKLGRLRERERDWEEYRGISQMGRRLEEGQLEYERSGAGEEMQRRYEESLAKEQAKREYYESLAGKESEEYMKYLQGELKRIKAGKITGDLESVKGRQTQATKDVGINRHKAPPTWEHYWSNMFKTPDTPADELMSRVDSDLKGKNLVDAVTEELMQDETEFVDPFGEQVIRGGFPRFYSQYREYLIEGPQGKEVTFAERATDPTIKSYEKGEQLTGPLEESQIELKLDRLMDLSRRRYRSKAEQLLLEKGYITEDDTRMRWED
jgi:hypothetical protein